ncbi:MAG TPA: thioredoxin-disulfide reductase [Chloroflexi bacterium]|nr:thioredoxin-disulfide reductase [Chloroflexota bacterium]
METTPPEGEPRNVKVLIIGSGPAGLSAALYAARADLAPVVLSGMDLGGQVSQTHIIENYPGFPEGISGSGLVEAFQKQAERFGAEIVFDMAIEADFSRRPFRIKTHGGEFLAESVIIATGATPRKLGVPGEEEFVGRGVSYCATCDGHFFKGMDVVVVGGGDSALEEGLFLTRYAASVTLIHRRDTLRAGAILQKRAREHPKIKFVWNTVVTEIQGEDVVQAVRLKNVRTGEESTLPTSGVFIFIGHTPNTQLFEGQLEMDGRGYLIADERMRTSIPGVYVAGEAADPVFRQVITSAGMGAAAAIQVTHYLEGQA